MTTHTIYYCRPNGDEDDIDIEVHFTLTGGEAPSGMTGPPEHYDPGSAPEFCVEAAYLPNGEMTELTDEEYETVKADVFDRIGDFDDDGWEYF